MKSKPIYYKTRYISTLLLEGRHPDYVAEKLGISVCTVNNHLKKMKGLALEGPEIQSKYDWKAVQEYYDNGFSVTECKNKFGIAGRHWTVGKLNGFIVLKKFRKLNKETSTKKILLSDSIMFCENSQSATSAVRKRIIKNNLLPYLCSTDECLTNTIIVDGKPQWNGREITLQVDHINGVSNDHRLSNLRFLCANCHTQTSTFAGRNHGKTRENAVIVK